MSDEPPQAADPLAEPRALIDALLDGRLTADDARRLESLVRERADVRALYVRYLHQECVIRAHAGLSLPALPASLEQDSVTSADAMVLPALHATDESGEAALPTLQIAQARKPRPLPWPRVAAIAAVLLIGLMLWRLATPDEPARAPAVATLGELAGAQWDGPDAPPQRGAPLATAELRLRAGVVEIAFGDGARVLVAGPARFTPESPGRIALAAGQLTATVPPRAAGFTVRTNAGAIVDLGTEFGVLLAPDGSAAVEVFAGRVKAEARAATGAEGPTKVLAAGEAARVTVGSIVPEPAQPQRFVRDLRNAQPAPQPARTQTVAATTTRAAASTGAAVVKVDLSKHYNRNGITADGAASAGGGIDGGGFAYSAAQLSAIGNEFDLPPAVSANNLVVALGQTIPLPAGRYRTLTVLGAGINGKKPDMVFTIRYADGTRQEFTQSLSNWNTPSGFAGEGTALSMPYRNDATGRPKEGPTYVYRYTFTLDPAKAVNSLVLPKETRSVVLLAVNVGS